MLGADRFLLNPSYKRLRLGVLTNHATLTSAKLPLAMALLQSGFRIIRIFSPEHGVASQGEDGKHQSHQVDVLTGLPVISLYGNQLAPALDDIDDLDAIISDLPNIGCRFYTYWWTITHMLESCALSGRKVILLDRPNQSRRTASQSEGPLLREAECSSFLGRWTMPLTFSFTYGQLARWFCYERKIAVDLEVVPTDPDAGVFLPPSPAINHPEVIEIYPCTGLFEGIGISNGRGTTFPFRVLGAPWIDANQWHSDYQKMRIPGLEAVPFLFQPVWGTFKDQPCQGLYFTVSDFVAFKPVETGLLLLRYLFETYKKQISESPYPTVANPTGQLHLDRLFGIPQSFHTITSLPSQELRTLLRVNDWTERVDGFLQNSGS